MQKAQRDIQTQLFGERIVGGRLEKVKGLFLLGAVMEVENGGCTVRGGE